MEKEKSTFLQRPSGKGEYTERMPTRAEYRKAGRRWYDKRPSK